MHCVIPGKRWLDEFWMRLLRHWRQEESRSCKSKFNMNPSAGMARGASELLWLNATCQNLDLAFSALLTLLSPDEVAAYSEQGRRDPESVSLWIVWIRNLFPFSSLSPTLYLMHNSNSFFGPVIIMITLFSCEWSVVFLFLPLKLK